MTGLDELAHLLWRVEMAQREQQGADEDGLVVLGFGMLEQSISHGGPGSDEVAGDAVL